MNILKTIFNTISGRQKAVSSQLAQTFLRGDDWSEGSRGSLANPYAKSAWVRAAIKLVSGPISAVPVEFYPRTALAQSNKAKGRTVRRGGRALRVDPDEVISNPAVSEFLREPMAGMRLGEFIEASVGWRKLAGEAFWLLTQEQPLHPDAPGAGFKVVLARPDKMRHVQDGGKIAGWVWTDGANRQHTLLPEQVIHIKQWNPYDEHRGLGDYEAARIAAEGDYAASRFAKSIAAANGDTGPYIVAKNGLLSNEQREQLLADLRGKRNATLRGEFRPIVLSGDITVEDPQIRSVDAAYIAGRIESRHEIAIAFGVPPSLFDVKAAYSIGKASDVYQLIQFTCMPEADHLADAFAKVVGYMARLVVDGFFVWDEHPVMQEVREQRLASVDGLWSKGVPMSVVDEYLGLGLPDYVGKDVAYLPFSVSPVGSGPAEPVEDPDLAEEEQEEEEPVAESIRKAFEQRKEFEHPPTPEGEENCSCGCDVDQLEVKGRDPKEVALWREHMSKRRASLRSFEVKFRRELFEARKETLQKLEQNGPLLLAVKRGAAVDFIFNLENFKANLVASMRQASANALQSAGDQVMAELSKDDPWQMPAPGAREFFANRENKIKDCAQDVFENIMDTLKEGIENGENINKLSRRVREQFQVEEERAKRIAMTETSAAYGTGRHQAMRDSGIQWKKWLTSGNANVRSAHRAMNGDIVAIGEKFIVADPKSGQVDEVDHPGDPMGAPWNVINCHCVEIAVSKGPEGEVEG